MTLKIYESGSTIIAFGMKLDTFLPGDELLRGPGGVDGEGRMLLGCSRKILSRRLLLYLQVMFWHQAENTGKFITGSGS